MDGMTLRLTKAGGAPGDERLVIAGSIMLAAGSPPVLDPGSSGLQLLIEDVGAHGALLDLTAATAPIPPGPKGTGCDAKDGWKKTTYDNRSDALAPPSCPPGSARGLRRIRLKDRRARGRGVSFSLQTQGGALPMPIGPVRLTLVLGATRAAGAGGLCGTHVFSSCTAKGATYRCR